MYVTNCSRTIIADNYIIDSLHPVRMMNCPQSTVANNNITSAVVAERLTPCIYLSPECLRSRVSGNTFRGTMGSTVAVVAVFSAESQITDNIDYMVNSRTFIESSANSVALHIDGNHTISGFLIIDTTGVYDHIMRGPNFGGGTRSNKVIFATKIPENNNLIAWNRGDIVFNTDSDNTTITGWICTAAGKPGTWRIF